MRQAPCLFTGRFNRVSHSKQHQIGQYETRQLITSHRANSRSCRLGLMSTIAEDNIKFPLPCSFFIAFQPVSKDLSDPPPYTLQGFLFVWSEKAKFLYFPPHSVCISQRPPTTWPLLLLHFVSQRDSIIIARQGPEHQFEASIQNIF